MAEPACKDCKFFYRPPLMTKGGECMDPTKRIFPRRTASSEVNPPEIIDEEIYTCRNWTSKDAGSEPKIIAIHGGDDWADASADYVVLPPGVDVEKANADYRAWYNDVYTKEPRTAKYMSLHEWLVEKCGGRIPTNDELKVFDDQ